MSIKFDELDFVEMDFFCTNDIFVRHGYLSISCRRLNTISDVMSFDI